MFSKECEVTAKTWTVRSKKILLDSGKVRRLREARGFSAQEDLARATAGVDPKQAGIAARVVWDAENDRPISRRTQLLLAAALGIADPDELRASSPTSPDAEFENPDPSSANRRSQRISWWAPFATVTGLFALVVLFAVFGRSAGRNQIVREAKLALRGHLAIADAPRRAPKMYHLWAVENVPGIGGQLKVYQSR